MKFVIFIGIFLLIQTSFQRSQIVTLAQQSSNQTYTTGNIIQDLVDFETLHLPSVKDIETEQISEEKLNKFENFKKNLILDFSNKDPQIFRPELPDYWRLAMERGQIFELIGIIFLFVAVWTIYVRVSLGECGGYKTVIHKPSREKRLRKIYGLVVGITLFTIGFNLSLYQLWKEKQISEEVSQSLVSVNAQQLRVIDNGEELYEENKGILQILQYINNLRFDVVYSMFGYERYHVGIFIDQIIQSYQESLKNAKQIQAEYFQGSRTTILSKALLVAVSYFSIIMYFIYNYKRRKTLVSLVLSFLTLTILIFSFHVQSDIFNVFTIQFDMCKEVKQYQSQAESLTPKRIVNESVNNLVTCLDRKDRQILKSQMVSLLIGQNTLRVIMSNYISAVASDKLQYLGRAQDIIDNYNLLTETFKETANDSSITFDQLVEILYTYKLQLNVYEKLEVLENCEYTLKWSDELQTKSCEEGLQQLYIALIAFLISILGIFITAIFIYLSEELIKGLQKFEQQYVKINKLRYDWNQLNKLKIKFYLKICLNYTYYKKNSFICFFFDKKNLIKLMNKLRFQIQISCQIFLCILYYFQEKFHLISNRLQ